jgi:hypothetical protein
MYHPTRQQAARIHTMHHRGISRHIDNLSVVFFFLRLIEELGQKREDLRGRIVWLLICHT